MEALLRGVARGGSLYADTHILLGDALAVAENGYRSLALPVSAVREVVADVVGVPDALFRVVGAAFLPLQILVSRDVNALVGVKEVVGVGDERHHRRVLVLRERAARDEVGLARDPAVCAVGVLCCRADNSRLVDVERRLLVARAARDRRRGVVVLDICAVDVRLVRPVLDRYRGGVVLCGRGGERVAAVGGVADSRVCSRGQSEREVGAVEARRSRESRR